MIHHVTRATRHLIFGIILVSALGLTVIRLTLIGIDNYRVDLEARIATALGVPVKIGGLRATMRGITPGVILKNVKFMPQPGTKGKGIHIDEIRWKLNLGEYLLKRELLSSSAVSLIDADLSIYRASDGHFAIEGLKSRPGQPLWLLQGCYHVLNSRIVWQDRMKGGKPIVLDNTNLAVINEGNQHHVKAITQLPGVSGSLIKMVADIEGEIEIFEKLTGKFFIEGKQINLKEFVSSYLPLEIHASYGTADFQIWSRFNGESVVSASIITHLQDALFTREHYGQFSVKQLDAEFGVNLDQPTWRADFAKFELITNSTATRKGEHWANLEFSGSYTAATNAPVKVSAYSRMLDLAEIAQITAFFLPVSSEQAKTINASGIQGKLNNFVLYAEPVINSFAVAGEFDSVNMQPSDALPGFDHVSGAIKGTENVGTLKLVGKNTLLNYSKLFFKPVLFNRLDSQISWRQTDNEWSIASDALTLDCPAFTALSRVLISFPKVTPNLPFIDIQAEFKSQDITKVAEYFPSSIMNEKLNTWLTNALKGGRLTKGDMLWYGKAGDFPFTDGSGVFQVGLDLENVALKFHPDWQQIDAINGHLTIDKDTITGKFDGGQMAKVKINPTTMLISGLGGGDVKLNVKSNGEGEINDVLSILQHSPISAKVLPVINNTEITGRTQGGLDLTVPLTLKKPIVVNGAAELNNAQLSIKRINLPITQIGGTIKFSNQGLQAEDLRGFALGFPLKGKVNTVNQETKIGVEAKATSQKIADMLHAPAFLKANGESDFYVNIIIPPVEEKSPVQVSLKTDLSGIEFDLPAGIHKTKAQAKPLSISVEFEDKANLFPIKLDYNNELKAALKVGLPGKNIVSGNVLLGDGSVKLPAFPGLKIEINKSPLALQDYLPLAGISSSQNSAPKINEVKVNSNSVLWNKKQIGELRLNLKRNSAFWSGEIDSVFAKGVFDIPFDFSKSSPVLLNMDMLNLSVLKQFSFDMMGGGINDINVVPQIHCKQTLWRSVDLGQLVLETEKKPFGINIKRLSIDGQDESFVAKGEWQNINGLSNTVLQGQLAMSRADKLFSKLNITKDFTQTSGVVNFELSWPAAPWLLTLPDLRGKMDVKLNSGRILSIDPGIGRMLGILAMEQWIKRLKLDFSDIFAKGLSYNSIRGDFTLFRGKATTQDLIIDSVPAKITITGTIDYVNQTVDHLVKVVPKSLAAVPIAGTIMDKIADFLTKILTGKDQEGFFLGKQYTVKGSWYGAEIKPLHKNDGILQKTWANIFGGE